MPVLKDLLENSKDGEWGKSEPFDESVEMSVIRGTDFESARVGSVEGVPERFIAKRHHDRKVLKPWDILLETAGGSKNRPTGRTLLVKPALLRTLGKPATCASFARFLRIDNSKAYPPYVFWLLQHLYSNGILFKYHTQHTGVARFQYTSFAENEELILPSLDLQVHIASILSAYDDLIENNTRRIEILEEMARRLYEEWFVNFRFPGHEEVSFKESELGDIPEGWKPVAFSEVASFMNGFAFKPSHFTDDGLPVIKIKELKSGVTADTPRCSGEVKEKYLVKDGDVLFSWSAHLDAYIWRGGEGWLNQHLFKVDGVDGIPKSFLYFSLKEKMVDFRAKSMGTTMQHIKRSALNEVKFPMAAESLTSKFDDLVTPILNQVLLLQRKNGNLRAQRDLLLPKLVSGEIDVSDIPMPEDKEVEAA